MVSHYEYSLIMKELEYNYDTKEWEISSRFFKHLEPDHTLKFSSRRAAGCFVYDYLEGKLS